MMLKNRIRCLRESLNIPQIELARRLGICQNNIEEFESQFTNPNADQISEMLKIFDCSFDKLFSKGVEREEYAYQNLLITYYDNTLADLNFTKLFYGDRYPKACRLQNLNVDEDNNKGSYIFFHTIISDQHYITAYFYCKQILVKGINDEEIQKSGIYNAIDDVIVVADREKSKILYYPLLLDKKLVLELPSFGLTNDDFRKGMSELNTISNKTRYQRVLFSKDVTVLKSRCDKERDWFKHKSEQMIGHDMESNSWFKTKSEQMIGTDWESKFTS